ncbi:MAG: hypothetical protein ACLRFE_01980 [Clostridia bacterium]
MRLGCKIKSTIGMIAILLCMVFVVNVGATLASIDYRFKANIINTSAGSPATLNYDTYSEFASATGMSGKYVYSPGVYNNKLSINYGFNTSHNYDLMVKFTATYSNANHIANDFSINFVNRDDWCIDMGSVNGWKVENGDTVTDNSQVYYNLTSSTNTLNGTMYYMGTKTGSGTMPIISSVTFYTSPNNSHDYIGDVLSITLTPYYVQSNNSNYTEHTAGTATKHSFYSNDVDQDLFNNWVTYMAQKGNGTVATNASAMIYNAYVDHSRSLKYPYDSSVMKVTEVTTGEGENAVTKQICDVDGTLKEQPIYSNTAYRYQISTETVDGLTTISRAYNAITAGNKYFGGVGVYVIPSSQLVTIGISISYNWQKNNILAGTTATDVVTLQYNETEMQTIISGGTKYHYYRADINKPTYINVLDYIMFTAENYSSIILNDYSLILKDISVSLIENTNDIATPDAESGTTAWSNSYIKGNYEIHNSTTTSPVLARVKDVYVGSKTYSTDISITNNSLTPMAISGFTISSELWYSAYTTNNGTTSFNKANFTYLDNGTPKTVYLSSTGLLYDTSVWNEPEYNNGVFTFTSKSGVVNYIPSGYTMSLISGVNISNVSACQTETLGNDFWCSLSISNITTTTATYTGTSSRGVEIIAEGYYSAITSSNPGKIYIRNNTRQIITGVSLLDGENNTLWVRQLNGNSKYIVRDQAGSDAEYNLTEHLSGTISIKPGEMVLAYTITPQSGNAIIYDFKLTTTLQSGEETSNIDLVYNENLSSGRGVLINNSTSYYEFRLVSSSDIGALLINESDFEARVVTTNGNNPTTTYYYYYKGILCANQSIEVLKGFVNNITVDYLAHNSSKGASNYNASNYVAWGLDDTDDANWLNYMKSLYAEPTAEQRQNAEIVSAN